MSNSFNKCLFIGNVGSEPEMRYTAGGSPTTSFRIAVNRSFKNQSGELQEETEWVSIVTWSKLAENCNQFLSKGQKVFVEGRLHTRSWDAQDGQKRYRTEIIAERVVFLDKKQSGEKTDKPTQPDETNENIEPSDLPF